MMTFPIVVMCVRRDELAARAMAGDLKAIEVLLRIAPADLPARELVRQRDERLREIAQSVAESALSQRHLARILHQAWRRLSSPRGELTDAEPFQRISAPERQILTREIREVLRWSTWEPLSVGTFRTIIQPLGWPVLPPLRLASEAGPE